ncbi:L-asparaginase [Schizosaccharomyces pombe]|uniref:Probable L-asparaginase 3 n=1 Tax=Schizosaccharomyces pombe (strain 972 / ATCC 24843) TaxID=284812 RepID=ASPG3_SCHPO|nr:putative L-asparaginase [Schizosaccharomyces pombe]Q8NKC0.1 RecName: Full=Probable L-asparaginase 3; AltName: Full=L-asparagine amidohydrolase 3; Flags: Precursor [Schizosaccharomyces pombe 972h-]CAD31749.1 L-asparaginase (predicted) [Schizosaccharomyces pombe]|eukprot:NP_001018773.1 putative L-asparaginase [Schizosaccharomyces pombe]
MWSSIISFLFFSVALCQPLLFQKRSSNVSDFISFNASLPNVTIFAMGGTIAGYASSSTETVDYAAGSVGIATLVDAVPAIKNFSNIRGVQVTNVGSEELTPANVLNLTQLILAEVAKPDVHGIVVTHGTDSLEETAIFLDMTVNTTKPIVVVGAMRPSTAISADGPMNLLNAVVVAASNRSIGRGTMILLNDRIGSAFYTTKTNGNMLDTFKSYEAGFLGMILDQRPHFFYSPATPTGKVHFDVSNTTELPAVEILYGYQGLNPNLAKAAVDLGAKGLVLAGMGAASWTDPGNEVIDGLISNQSIPVVYSHRTMDGFSDYYYNGIPAYFQNPQKARYMLMLSINAGYSIQNITDIFSLEY